MPSKWELEEQNYKLREQCEMWDKLYWSVRTKYDELVDQFETIIREVKQ